MNNNLKIIKVLEINGESLHNSRGEGRNLDYKIRTMGLEIYKCPICGNYEIKSHWDLPSAGDRFELILIKYPVSPRGAHRITIEDNIYAQEGNYPATYEGWGCYPDKVFLPLGGHVIPNQVIAIRGDVHSTNIVPIAKIFGGKSGEWEVFIEGHTFDSTVLEKEATMRLHPSCVKAALETEDAAKEDLEELFRVIYKDNRLYERFVKDSKVKCKKGVYDIVKKVWE